MDNVRLLECRSEVNKKMDCKYVLVFLVTKENFVHLMRYMLDCWSILKRTFLCDVAQWIFVGF